MFKRINVLIFLMHKEPGNYSIRKLTNQTFSDLFQKNAFNRLCTH